MSTICQLTSWQYSCFGSYSSCSIVSSWNTIQCPQELSSRKCTKKGKAPKQNAIDPNSSDKAAAVEEKSTNHDLSSFDTGSVFTWENINYTVPVQGGERQLLNQVEGWIKPGEMTALMGSSGKLT
jgi:ABC-type glutathione transport system ATPase component